MIYYRALDLVLYGYKDLVFVINTIHCDGKYKSMMGRVKYVLNITLECVSRRENVPEAGRNNRTIKNIYREHYHRLPFKSVPNIMVR